MFLAAVLLSALAIQGGPEQSKGGWGKAGTAPAPAPVQIHPAQPWLDLRSTPLGIRVHHDAARAVQQRGVKGGYTFELKFTSGPNAGGYLADAQAFFHGYPVMGVVIRFLYSYSDRDHPYETPADILRVDFPDFPRSTQVDLSDPIRAEDAVRLSGLPGLSMSNRFDEPPFLVLYPRYEHHMVFNGSGYTDHPICKSMSLAYLFPMGLYYFFVDAHTGKVLAKEQMGTID